MREKKRDPRIDPRKGDELHSLYQPKWLIVDKVQDDEVVFRLFTSLGGPIALCRIPLEEWKRLAQKGGLKEGKETTNEDR